MSTALYVRASTKEQNLERQLGSTHEFAESDLGEPLSNLEVYRDKSTGTDTARSGYKEMMQTVETGEVGHVVSMRSHG